MGNPLFLYKQMTGQFPDVVQLIHSLSTRLLNSEVHTVHQHLLREITKVTAHVVSSCCIIHNAKWHCWIHVTINIVTTSLFTLQKETDSAE